MKEIKLLMQISKQIQIDNNTSVSDMKGIVKETFSSLSNEGCDRGNFHLFVKEYEITSLEKSNVLRTLDYYNCDVITCVPEASLYSPERENEILTLSTRRNFKSNRNNLLNSSVTDADPLVRSNIDEAYKNLENLKKTLNKTFSPDMRVDNLLDVSHRDDSFNLGRNNYNSRNNFSTYLPTDKNTYNNHYNENKILKEENENIFLTNQILNKSNLDLKTQLKNSLLEQESNRNYKSKMIELNSFIESLKKDLMVANRTNEELIRHYEILEDKVNGLMEENKQLCYQIDGINMNFSISEKTNNELKNNLDSLEDIYRKFENEKNILNIHLIEKDRQLEERTAQVELNVEMIQNLKKSIKDYEDMLENTKRTIEILSNSTTKNEEEVFKLKITMQEREGMLQSRISEIERLRIEITKLNEDKTYLINEVNCYKAEIHKREGNLQDVLDSSNKTKEDLQSYINRIANLSRILEDKDKTIENLKESYRVVNVKLEEIKSENDRNKDILSEDKIRNEKLKKDIAEHEQTNEKLKKRNEKLENDAGRIEENYNKLDEMYKTMTESKTNMKKTFDNSLTEMRRNLEAVNESEGKLIKENEHLTRRLTDVTKEKENLEKYLNSANEKLKELSQTNEKIKEELNYLSTKHSNLEKEKGELENKTERLLKENQDIKREIIENTNKFNEGQKLNTKLTAENMLLKEKCEKINNSLTEQLSKKKNEFESFSTEPNPREAGGNLFKSIKPENKEIITKEATNIVQPTYQLESSVSSTGPLLKSKQNFTSTIVNTVGNDENKTTQTLLKSGSIRTEISEGSKFIFRVYDNKRILRFDLENKQFKVIEFADYGGFESNFIPEGSIYLNGYDGLFIVTGDNHDILYHFSHQKMTVSKIVKFNDNHSHGALVLDEDSRSLICLSGWHNRKVEKYTNSDLVVPYFQSQSSFSKAKTNLTFLPEMNVERSESAYIILNKTFLYSFFGYCCPKAKYLDTVECLNLTSDSAKWKTIRYSNEEHVSTFIKSHLVVKLNERDLFIIGGVDGLKETPIENFIKYDIIDNTISLTDRKLPDIIFNHSYNFQKDSQFVPFIDINNRLHVAGIDEMDNVHSIEVKSLQYDIFKFD